MNDCLVCNIALYLLSICDGVRTVSPLREATLLCALLSFVRYRYAKNCALALCSLFFCVFFREERKKNEVVPSSKVLKTFYGCKFDPPPLFVISQVVGLAQTRTQLYRSCALSGIKLIQIIFFSLFFFLFSASCQPGWQKEMTKMAGDEN